MMNIKRYYLVRKSYWLVTEKGRIFLGKMSTTGTQVLYYNDNSC